MDKEYDIDLLNKFYNQYIVVTSVADSMINNLKESLLRDFKPDFQKFFQEKALYDDSFYIEEDGHFIDNTSGKTLEEAKSFYTNINTIKHFALLAAYDLYRARTEDDYIVASYNLGLFTGFILHHEKNKAKARKAGKAKADGYQENKEQVIQYAQNLLQSTSAKYTVNALADKITHLYLLGNFPGLKFNTDNPKPTIYRWIKELPNFQSNEKNFKA